jgi:hypothetical protein
MAHPPDKDEYNVVVAQRGQFARRWEWEIFRNGRPLPVPLRNGQFWSERSARLIAELQAAGVASPRAIAEALNERLVPPLLESARRIFNAQDRVPQWSETAICWANWTGGAASTDCLAR